jgi:hypothetical protein
MLVGQDFGIWMIKTCALDWPFDEIRARCENNSSEIGKLDKTKLTISLLDSSKLFYLGIQLEPSLIAPSLVQEKQ